MRLGGRVAEELVFGIVSTGAKNDLVGATELARKMVREWGMCDRIGPMAWGSQGAVFLGEDLMHTRDYSDETARVIDEEVERILRDAGGPLPQACSTSTAPASTSSPRRCSSTRRSTAPRSSASSSSVAPAAARVAAVPGCPTGGPGTGGGDSSASVPSAAGLTRSPYPGSTEPRTVPVTEPAGGEQPVPQSEPAHASDAEPATADDDRPTVWAHRHGATPPPAT